MIKDQMTTIIPRTINVTVKISNLFYVSLMALSQELNLKSTQRKYSNIIQKDPYIKFELNDLLAGNVLDNILATEYKYETLNFGRKREFKTTKGYLKFITKTIDFNYNLVYQDIVSKQFNGLKTVITLNTKMHKIFMLYEKAKPMNIFNIRYKKINHLLPRVKEFYNFTGFTKGYKTFQFFDNLNYEYTSNLKPFGEVKLYLISQFIKALIQHFTLFSATLFTSQLHRKARFNVIVNGFNLKINNKHLFKYRMKFLKLLNIKPLNRTLKKKFKIKNLFKALNKLIFKKFKSITPHKRINVYKVLKYDI